MGCANYFKYHPNASVEDYAKRFGYNTEVLRETVKKTKEYDISKARRGGNEQIAMREALMKLDIKNETDALYGREMTSGKVFNFNGYTSVLMKEVVKKIFDSEIYRTKKSKGSYRSTGYVRLALQENIFNSPEQPSVKDVSHQYHETLYKSIAEIFEDMIENNNEVDKENLLEHFMFLIFDHFKNENDMCCICGESLNKKQSNLCENCLEFITKLIFEKIGIIDLGKIISELDERKAIENHQNSKSLFSAEEVKFDIIQYANI